MIYNFTLLYSSGVEWTGLDWSGLEWSGVDSSPHQYMHLAVFCKESSGVHMDSGGDSKVLLAKDNKFHVRTKHINLRYHFIHEVVEDGKIQVKYVLMDDNISDIFTKPLPRPKFAKFVELLGLRRLDGTKAKHRC